MLCYCDTGNSYEACCGKYHTGAEKPEDALTLMRSRYSAYAKNDVDYVINTTHRENSQFDKITKRWQAALRDYCKQVEFNGLKIIDFKPGEQTATVTFEVKMNQAGKDLVLLETSLFKKAGQRWLYHSGDTSFTESE